jgi:hypothetical protein
MSSARVFAIVLLLPLATLAQGQSVVFYSGPPIPRVDCAALAHSYLFPEPLLQLPLDSQKSLLEPRTSINPFDQPPRRSQNFFPNDDAQKRQLDELGWCIALNGFGPNPRLATHVLPEHRITLEGSELCYSIRSYLMARDSRDSDSTHLAGTSTCQPAHHYSLKTTDPQPHATQP